MAEGRGKEMKYKLWFDEDKGVLYIKTFGMLSKPEIDRLMAEIKKSFEGKTHRYILANVSDSPVELIDKEARQIYRKYAPEANFEKIAIVGASPTTRMIAKVAIAVFGKTDITRFFKDEDEAFVWLKR